MLINPFNHTDFNDAVLDALQRRLSVTRLLSYAEAAVTNAGTKTAAPETMTRTSKTHENNLHDIRWGLFVLFSNNLELSDLSSVFEPLGFTGIRSPCL